MQSIRLDSINKRIDCVVHDGRQQRIEEEEVENMTNDTDNIDNIANESLYLPIGFSTIVIYCITNISFCFESTALHIHFLNVFNVRSLLICIITSMNEFDKIRVGRRSNSYLSLLCVLSVSLSLSHISYN